MSGSYTEEYWTSPDGLKLYYRDYAGPSDKLPVLCLHGLTRNSRDFAPVAEELAGDRRIIVPEMRGRGNSEYAKDTATYTPPTYIKDVETLLSELGIESFVVIGTSMGGLMTMLMAARDAKRIAAAVLNDIGPEIDPKGLAHIASYVGQGRSFDTWMHAANSLRETHGASFPDYSIDDWLEMAKRTMVLGQNGRIALDYDMGIAEPFRSANDAPQPDLWPAFKALSETPTLLVRGELSDLLSEQTLERMTAEHGTLRTVTVPSIGHAPMLDEPESIAAIKSLLADVA
ncbi:alpha/beta fold hydrolase [Altererythrobacter ishigakiensis]|uniref:Pimeloyl-ACP methyl ester carboxylesterase n=1 Tax=Altererythrobacter ishigakiensis TaxID=476157 RepID=A0A562UVK8_9SPHN|nr:alpha/beta hydrolase [Altererythrobacter ishigakiensis]TWJ09670.1 pimeloyl-ACP methyl ester carboxylesterase [Altererythrobacter ishigakiensis]